MKRQLLALAALSVMPFAASAAELSYSYVEAGYNLVDVDPRIEGGALNGSFAITENFSVFGGYALGDIHNTGISVERARVGGGYNLGVFGNTDLVVRAGYQRTDTDLASSEALDGYFAEVGLRGQLNPNFEGYILAGYDKFESVRGEHYVRVGFQANINQNWGIVVDAKKPDSYAEFFIGPRFSF